MNEQIAWTIMGIVYILCALFTILIHNSEKK
jgi:hypothetical protein